VASAAGTGAASPGIDADTRAPAAAAPAEAVETPVTTPRNGSGGDLARAAAQGAVDAARRASVSEATASQTTPASPAETTTAAAADAATAQATDTANALVASAAQAIAAESATPDTAATDKRKPHLVGPPAKIYREDRDPIAANGSASDAEAPRTPDDLQRIKGIGPVVAAQLAALGISRFDEIAAWTRDDVARMDLILSFKGRIDREDWIGQAKALSSAAHASPNAKASKMIGEERSAGVDE